MQKCSDVLWTIFQHNFQYFNKKIHETTKKGSIPMVNYGMWHLQYLSTLLENISLNKIFIEVLDWK
jgi:hypothetical protein